MKTTEFTSQIHFYVEIIGKILIKEIQEKTCITEILMAKLKLDTFTQPNGIVGSQKLKNYMFLILMLIKLMFMIFKEMEN